jgi:hypothetical protein
MPTSDMMSATVKTREDCVLAYRAPALRIATLALMPSSKTYGIRIRSVHESPHRQTRSSHTIRRRWGSSIPAQRFACRRGTARDSGRGSGSNTGHVARSGTQVGHPQEVAHGLGHPQHLLAEGGGLDEEEKPKESDDNNERPKGPPTGSKAFCHQSD